MAAEPDHLLGKCLCCEDRGGSEDAAVYDVRQAGKQPWGTERSLTPKHRNVGNHVALERKRDRCTDVEHRAVEMSAESLTRLHHATGRFELPVSTRTKVTRRHLHSISRQRRAGGVPLLSSTLITEEPGCVSAPVWPEFRARKPSDDHNMLTERVETSGNQFAILRKFCKQHQPLALPPVWRQQQTVLLMKDEQEHCSALWTGRHPPGSMPPRRRVPVCSPRSGGHVSPASQGTLGNYRHPSEDRCSCSSLAVAIITAPRLTSAPWARSPSGLSRSRQASPCQA
ncbi:hypothetical protein EYF80_044800 [Liparis tanakae]|uniref:Uncharacterized protein n=1 Tax=Liparis tanakae TaxID=230148 RepID=A0A4Z2FVS9_9TELE|nr:hypothetical protein EYF80_044800 [Liparis tanakae]